MRAISLRRFLVCLLALVMLGIAIVALPVTAQQPATAPPVDGALKAEVTQLAAVVADYIKRDKQGVNLEVKQYKCGREIAASAGPGIQKTLIEELGRLGVKHTPGAAVTCEGEYTFLDDRKQVIIETKIRENGFTKFEPKFLVSDLESILKVTGATAAVDVKATPDKQLAAVAEAIKNPSVAISPSPAPASPAAPATPAPPATGVAASKSQAQTSLDSPFGIELCRKNKSTGTFEPVELEKDGGLAFALLQDTDAYGIHVHNRANFPVAVDVNIDGLNLFVLSEIPQFKALGKLIIPAGKSHLIQGWFVTNEKGLEFLVTQLPNSLAAKLGGAGPLKNPEKVGTVTVTFCAAVTDPQGVLPPGEPDLRSLATTTGVPVGTQYKTSPVIIGKPRESISIRYDRPTDLPPSEVPPAVGK